MTREGFFEISLPGSTSDTIRFLDLTQPIGPSGPQVAFPVFAASLFADYEKDGAYARMITVNEHLGTHVDAPSHWVKGQQNIDKVPISQLIGPAAVINIEERASQNPDYRVSLEDISEWEKINGRFAEGAFILLASGWDKRWSEDDKTRYMNKDRNDAEHFPGFSDEVYSFLVDNRNIRGVGTDCFRPEGGLEPPPSPDVRIPRPGHDTLCGHGKLIIENMRNLVLLPPTGAIIILGVIPYEGGSGGQARILALLA